MPRAPLARIAVLDDFGGGAFPSADWSGLPVQVFDDHLFDENALAERLRDFDALVLIRERTPVPASLIARLPKLRLIVTTGMVNRTLDLAACDARGIAVCGTHSIASPTAELTWALILDLARRVTWEDRALRQGHWQTGTGLSLEGAVLGVLGLGRIGARVAAIARAFAMDVIAWSPNLTEARAAEHGARCVEKDALFGTADIVTLHLGLGETTRGVVGAAEIARMRPGTLLVNTARGPLVDQDALIAALRSGHLGGAALDVFDVEPLPAAHPLRDVPNTILTPHLGYVTTRNYRAYFEGATACLRAWNAGQPLPRPLNASAQANDRNPSA
jgi:phosphoglycerate dehydrogenase-like enzyme